LKDIIRYILGDEKLLDDIKELWEALNEHHNEKSLHFKEFYNKFSFDARKADLIKQAQKSHMRVIISFDDAVQKGVGYCISSVDNDNNGEIESIFVLQGYRGFGIGEELMQKGLQWMDEMGRPLAFMKGMALSEKNNTGTGQGISPKQSRHHHNLVKHYNPLGF
jgi:ribosomal protein S18 acetylase RimI-like enzyme